MNPENILEDRSRDTKFGTMWCRFSGIEPEKALCDRSRSNLRFWMNRGNVPFSWLPFRYKNCRQGIRENMVVSRFVN